jgi:hypothetical protein
MTKGLQLRVAAMQELHEELLNGGIWENICGYSLNDELLPFMDLTEEYV